MALVSDSLRTTCNHLDCTISHLADKAEIHRSALSRIQNGHEDMSHKLLAKLMAVAEISDDDAAALAEDWTLDHWPMRAKQLLMLQRRRERESNVVREDSSPSLEDGLGRIISDLHSKARENPALARALRNLNRTLDGRTDVAD